MAVPSLLRRAIASQTGLWPRLPSMTPRTMYRPRGAPSLAPRPLRISLPKRAYSTAPDQNQVAQTFSTPFAHFVYTLSRIARIIIFYASGAAVFVLIAFEGTHQYVERVAMRAPSTSISISNDDPDDVWGWEEEAFEEGWSSTGGTDSRLGIRGRHAVRSAWICVNWGGGLAPGLVFSAGSSGPYSVQRSTSWQTVPMDESFTLAESYLVVGLNEAEKKGLRLPDPAALRAGAVSTPQQIGGVPLDQTAVTLETRLASVRERIGSPAALAKAAAGYERVFDALQNFPYTPTEQSPPAPRMVRLASKLGNIYLQLGRRDDAERWLLRAVGMAEQRAVASSADAQGEFSLGVGRHILGEITAEPEREKSSNDEKGSLGRWFAGSRSGSRDSPTVSLPAMASPAAHMDLRAAGTASREPQPALTRALVSTLLYLSALYALPPPGTKAGAIPSSEAVWRTSLEKALRVEASALRLVRDEQQRLAALQTGHSISAPARLPRTLHALWLMHHDALVSMHVAETIYALSTGTSSSAIAGALEKLTAPFKSGASSGKRHVQSVAWLKEAHDLAERVQKALAVESKGKAPARTNEGSDAAIPLQESWAKASPALQSPAARLLRDARRISDATEEMLALLDEH